MIDTRSCWMILFCAAPLGSVAGADRPNFLVILGEGQGWASTSVLMDPDVLDSRSLLAETPALERLADEGMTFVNGYAASPRCTPSRAALFTGKTPARLRMTFVSERADPTTKLVEPEASTELPVKEVTIGDLLKTRGYATAHFGKWHVGRIHPSRHGFDESDGPTSNRGPKNVQHPNPIEAFGTMKRGIDFMSRQVAAGKPFYLQISHYGGRSAVNALKATYERVRSRGGARAKGNELGGAAVTEDMDTTIRMLLAELDRLEIADSTYVVYTADHGTPGRNGPLSGGKGGVFEGGLRVPFLVRGPGIEPGSRSRLRVSGIDLFPTLHELAGVERALPAGIDGGSLVRVLRNGGRGTVKRTVDELLFHFPHYDKDSLGPTTALIDGNEKLIHVYESDTNRLFDLEYDLGERRDLAASRPDRTTELAKRMDVLLTTLDAQRPHPRDGAAVDAAATNGRSRGRGGDRNARQFLRLFDTDRDGAISRPERDAAAERLRRFDENGDGQLSAAEVNAAVGRRESQEEPR